MSDVSRRVFLGSVSVAAGAGVAAQGESAPQTPLKAPAMTPELRNDIRTLVDKTPIVDTHEHLWEESLRLKTKNGPGQPPPPDFGIFFCHYSDSDLQVAGMSGADCHKLTSRDIDVRDKWKLVAPYYERCRNAGYQLCIRESVRALYGIDDLTADTFQAVSDQLASMVQPGFYKRILRDVANIEYAQVNSLDAPVFQKAEEQPDLLMQDISTIPLATGPAIESVSHLVGRELPALKDFREAIDWCFATFGPRAIAVKNQCAYGRALDFDKVSEEDAAPIYARLAADPKSVSPAESKALQDHLFHYTVDKAAEYHLPVKLHTGYYAGHNSMPLERLRRNAGDLCPLFLAHPNTKFVLMHIDYPYQDELIALAKQYSNVYADMCWAWIINPMASVRFLKEILMAAPACKVFTFGGDYRPVEPVVGHARIARRGITQAVTELVEERWIDENDVEALVERIMRGNAHDIYEYDRALRNWSKA